MAGVRFSYVPSRLLKRLRISRGGALHKHEAWADAILPADAAAAPLDEPMEARSLAVLPVALVLAILILVGRLFIVQIMQGSHNAALADGNRLHTKITRAQRGVMYDRNGKILVHNQPLFDVVVNPGQLPRTAAARALVYQKVSQLLNISTSEVMNKAESKGLNWSDPLLIASNIDRDRALAYEAAGQLQGVSLEVNTIRAYQDGGSLGSVLGYTGRISAQEYQNDTQGAYQPTDYIGKNGLERQYESILRGVNGSEQTEVDVQQRPVKVLASRPSVAGDNITLTIDTSIQAKLVEVIQKPMAAAGAGRAAGVVLQPKTGQILAMASLPGYDNNVFAKGISNRDYQALIQNPNQPLFNKAFQGAYPVGSIIKPLVAIGALTDKVITPNTTVEDTGSLKITNQYDSNIVYTYRTWEPGGLGVVNLSRAIALSSDVFFYTVGGGYGPIKGLGAKRLDMWYQKFGLGARTGVDLPAEASGLVPSPESKKQATGEAWTLGDSYNISVGQGDLLASPLQMAVATAAVANGGTLYKPYLVSRVTHEDGRQVTATKPTVIRSSIASSQVIDTVRQAMRQVITSGTACCKIEQEVPVPVAGKTGTAETDPTNNKKPNSWFTSFAPYDDPQLVTVILIENAGEGAEYAAPATRELLSWYFRR